MANLPNEIVVKILSFTTLKDLLKIANLSKFFLNLVKKIKWNHLVVKLKNTKKYQVCGYQL